MQGLASALWCGEAGLCGALLGVLLDGSGPQGHVHPCPRQAAPSTALSHGQEQPCYCTNTAPGFSGGAHPLPQTSWSLWAKPAGLQLLLSPVSAWLGFHLLPSRALWTGGPGPFLPHSPSGTSHGAPAWHVAPGSALTLATPQRGEVRGWWYRILPRTWMSFHSRLGSGSALPPAAPRLLPAQPPGQGLGRGVVNGTSQVLAGVSHLPTTGALPVRGALRHRRQHGRERLWNDRAEHGSERVGVGDGDTLSSWGRDSLVTHGGMVPPPLHPSRKATGASGPQHCISIPH